LPLPEVMCLHLSKFPFVPLTFIKEVDIPNTGLKVIFNVLLLVIAGLHAFIGYSYLFRWNAELLVTSPKLEFIQTSILEGLAHPTDQLCYQQGRRSHSFLGFSWEAVDQCVQVCDARMENATQTCANPFHLIRPETQAWLLEQL